MRQVTLSSPFIDEEAEHREVEMARWVPTQAVWPFLGKGNDGALISHVKGDPLWISTRAVVRAAE